MTDPVRSIRVSDELWESSKRLAGQRGKKVGALVVDLLEREVRGRGPNQVRLPPADTEDKVVRNPAPHAAAAVPVRKVVTVQSGSTIRPAGQTRAENDATWRRLFGKGKGESK